MAFTASDIIEELKIHAPRGVEVPRSLTDNTEATATMTRWISDAVRLINKARKKTTVKETTITLVANQSDYDLPADARTVLGIVRDRYSPTSSEVLGVPDADNFGLTPGSFGTIPSGQEVDLSVDLILRTRAERLRREDDHEMFEGKIRFLFPISAGEEITVRYRAVDSDIASLPDDYFTHVLTFARYQLIDWFVGREAAGVSDVAGAFGPDDTAALFRLREDLGQKWNMMLGAITAENA